MHISELLDPLLPAPNVEVVEALLPEPRPAQWFERFDPITAKFTYVRWLGDRKGIEEGTKTWDEVIVDRHDELAECAELLAKVAKRGVLIYGTPTTTTRGMRRRAWSCFGSCGIGRPGQCPEAGSKCRAAPCLINRQDC